MPYMSDAHLLRLQEEYRDVAPVATALASMVVRELQASLQGANVALAVPIESRVKTWDSIEQGFLRAGSHLGAFRRFSGATLSELSDLIGIRVIVLFARDIARVTATIGETFRVLEADDKGRHHGVDQFGYASVHVDVAVPQEWSIVPSMRAFDRFAAEVQVRTLAQHMWAAASHELQYKVEQSVPDEVRRSIHRIASLLETVDTEYERLLVEREKYRAQIESGRADSRMNTDVLRIVLDRRLPRRNKAGYEPYSMLVWELAKLGVVRRSDLEALIDRHLEAALAQDGEIVGRRTDSGNEGADDHFFSHTGLLNVMLEKEFGVGFHSIIFKKVETELKGVPQGSRVIGEPWPHKPEGVERVQDARELLGRATSLIVFAPAELQDTLTTALVRFEQRIQLYEYGELSQVSLEHESKKVEEIVNQVRLMAKHNPDKGGDA